MRNVHLCSKTQLCTRLGPRTDNTVLWRQRESRGEERERRTKREKGKPKEETEAKEKGREVQ